MDNAELKQALQSQKPVVYTNAYGEQIHSACVSGITYRIGNHGKIVISAELLDFAGNSVITVDPARLEYEKGA